MDFSPASSRVAEYVYVPVPAAKVEDVFRFLTGLPEEQGEADSNLEKIVRRVYVESEEQFRSLLRFLADRPGRSISTVDVADALGLPSGAASLAGMLGAFARRSKNRYESFWPFERLYNSVQDRAELMMEEDVAAIVNGLDLPS